jgi:cytidylate kinase
MHIVAIDGPAGSGKSSVSKAVARKLGFGYLDTGAAYRALTWLIQSQSIALSSIDEKFLTNDFDYQISLDPDDYWVRVGNKDVTYEIRESSIGEKVSAVSGLSLIRQHMLDSTHDLVLNSGFEGVVVEGRDITTVVFPSAQTRILLTASEEVRLRRRSAELPEGISIAEQITKRDQNDAKVVDFFSPAQGVELVDSTELDFGSTVEAIIRIIERTK